VGFCRSLGLRGFANFKIELARELTHSGLSGDNAQESKSTLLQRVFKFHAQNLMETLQINTEDAFQRAAQMLGKARRIEFFSTGISFGVAYTTRCKLRLIGLPANTEFDFHLQLVAATQLRPGDVAVGISCSGSTRETVECLKIARSKHAQTICVTNSMKSPITEYADVALYATPSEVKYFQAPMASRVTQLAVIDALFVSVVQKRKDKTAKLLHDSGQELLKRRIS
jgi:DNA-binding MurR/RpiR family transcriptional regulator